MAATFPFNENITQVGPAAHDSVTPEQLAESVRAALETPLGYPPLSESTVPGDRAVVTFQRGVPLVDRLMAGVSSAFREAGIESSQTSIMLCSESKQFAGELGRLASEGHISVGTHDPQDDDDCAYVGVTQSGMALRVNRQLSDADIVLPVGLTSLNLDGQPGELYCGLFPNYCDQETITRYRDYEKADWVDLEQSQQLEIDELGWLLGVGLTVQVVPGVGNTVAAVLAGEPSVVAEAAAEIYRQIWSCPIASRGDLAIATISGAAGQPSWHDLAKALAAAQSVVEPGGAIAICAQLTEPPGQSLGRLIGGNDYLELERELQGDHFSDTGTALSICRALEQGPVYLRSELEADLVESLGLTPIGSDAELSRLIDSYHRPVLLEDAHRLLPTMSECLTS
jgi:hypothetical protein